MQSCRSITVAHSPPAILSDFAGTQEIETKGGSLAFPLNLTAASRFSLSHAELTPSHRPSSSVSLYPRPRPDTWSAVPCLNNWGPPRGGLQICSHFLIFKDTPLTMCRRSSRHICMVQYFQGDIVSVWDLTSKPVGFHPPVIRCVDRPPKKKTKIKPGSFLLI